MAGLSSIGWVAKTLTEIKTDLETAFRQAFGSNINLTSQGRFGQIIGITSERFHSLWEAGEELYAAFTPDGANDVALDDLSAITGTVRRQASESLVTLVGTASASPTTLLAGRQVSDPNDVGTRFETLEDTDLLAVPAWAIGTVYAKDALVTNGGNVYAALVAGTSAGAGPGPTSELAVIADNTVTWSFCGAGTAAAYVSAQHTQTGPRAALARTLTQIESPVSGWQGVINLEDADLGSDLETDAALRSRRELELRAGGLAAADAIRGRVLRVAGVTACTVFVNDEDATDADGVPPHSFETLVQGGDDAAIAAAIWASKAGGIRSHGTTSVVHVDSQGFSRTVKFSRPVARDIWVIVNATIDPNEFPSNGDDLIEDAITTFGDAQRAGKDAVSSSIGAQAFKVDGVLDVVALIGLVNPPTLTTTVPVSLRQLARFDTSRITVNTTNGVP